MRRRSNPEKSDDLHGLTGGDEADGNGQAGPWAKTCPPSTEMYSGAESKQTTYPNRQPTLPSSQGGVEIILISNEDGNE